MSQKSSSYGTDESELDSDIEAADEDVARFNRRKSSKMKRWIKLEANISLDCLLIFILTYISHNS